jgi:hypothetical protein
MKQGIYKVVANTHLLQTAVIRPADVETCSVGVASNGHFLTAEDQLQTPSLTADFLPHRGLVAWSVVGTAHLGPAVAHVGAVVGAAIVVTGAASSYASAAAVAAVAIVLSPQRREPLLLGVCVDVCADDEADDVEEGHPCGLGEELLGKGQRDGRDDPADLHDGPEAGLDGGFYLVECTGAGDERHGDEVHAVLDGGDLGC